MNDKSFNFSFYGVFVLVLLGILAYVFAVGFILTHSHELAKATGSLAHDFMQGLNGSGQK